jgi:hypothetical protein
MLDLSTGTRIYLGSRLYDKNGKVRNGTLFFKLNGVLPADGSAGKKIKSILIESITRLIGQFILVKGKKRRRRR